MEPTKFENHIKETLKGNEIKPSEDAWEKIKAQIKSEKEPKRIGAYWFAIAACFMGIMILSVRYFTADITNFNQEVQVATKPQIQGANEEKDELLKNAVAKKKNLAPVIEDARETETEKSISSANIASKKELAKAEEVLPVNKEELQNKESVASNELIDSKLVEVLARVNALEVNNQALTDLEVDSLLRQAQKEILAQELLNSEYKVNPSTLLSQVEEELDQSFRDQIFEKLKSGYNRVRTAVADRNN